MHNPYAFPHPYGAQGCDGMTLRDWFAGQALNGMLAGLILDDGHHSPVIGEPEVFARKVYAIADAMLTERTKPHAE